MSAFDDLLQTLAIGDGDIAEQTLVLARHLLERSQALQTDAEHRQQHELDRLIQNPDDKCILTQITDQSFRSHEASRAADQLIHILDVQGIPRFFSPVERVLLRGFQSFGDWLPSVSMPLVQDKMRKETANVILPAERDELSAHIRQRNQQGVRMNVNMLGEALLGEQEAQKRLARYLDILSWPEIRFMSVKISTIYSQISPLNREHSIEILCDRLDQLYSQALAHDYENAQGQTCSKFIYLDMEEFRDLHITVDAFMRCLDRPHLAQAQAGIVLQAYIPDSSAVQQRICDWAQQRVAKGAAAITMRIVKGANMEMERVLADQSGVAMPCFTEKNDTDMHYKQMLHYGMSEQRCTSVRLGIASHNLFDIAYAMLLAQRHASWPYIQFEMLEGMANHQRRAIQEVADDILLYAPACRQHEFINAIGYLVRRLDENTGADNFLRHTFNLKLDSQTYKHLEAQWKRSHAGLSSFHAQSFRQQDRRTPIVQRAACKHWWNYQNEAETDIALPHNSQWAARHIDEYRRQLPLKDVTPIVVAGQTHIDRHIIDRQQVNKPQELFARHALAHTADISAAISCAANDPQQWSQTDSTERCALLRRAAELLRQRRAHFICTAMAETGKTFLEADVELNEAIDFIEFYSACMQDLDDLDGIHHQAIGPVCVIPPWNFPIAIPCGGISAALATGNPVIVKPAPESIRCAYELCQAFWDAGISSSVLQFVPATENRSAQALLEDPRIKLHILTGASQTAQHFYQVNPHMQLSAETGGKNSIIVTSLADRDLAIKYIIHSAFGHSGQKCSACSLLILEAEVYDDPDFKQALCDATASLCVDASWNLSCKINPLIHEPHGELAWALNHLEAGESWALQAQVDEHNPQLYAPGIKYGVQAGSRSHQNEFFGPVLSVMRADSLQHAITLANSTPYGLTAGLHSLDDREQDVWRARIQAGNLYINRPITGAIVLRQPFGGFGASAYGPALKAGGPNYIMQLRSFVDDAVINYDRMKERSDLHQFIKDIDAAFHNSNIDIPTQELYHAADSYHYWAQHEFLREHDHQRLTGQDNIRRYVPVHHLRLRLEDAQHLAACCKAILASVSVSCRCTVSLAPNLEPLISSALHQATIPWAAQVEVITEHIDELKSAIKNYQCDRLRLFTPDTDDVLLRLAPLYNCYIDRRPVLQHGRIELLAYMREQSISFDYHRYGNLGKRQHQ